MAAAQRSPLTLADVTICRDYGGGHTQKVCGRDLAVLVDTAAKMLGDRYLNHDQCSLEIREVADTLDMLAISDGIDERLDNALSGLSKRLHHLADRVDDLRMLPQAWTPEQQAARYQIVPTETTKSAVA